MRGKFGPDVRLLVSVVVFVAVSLACAGATASTVWAFETQNYELSAVCALMVTWIVLAYFPARATFVSMGRPSLQPGVRCTSCGYDLRGNESGTCSECGKDIDAAGLLRQLGSLRRSDDLPSLNKLRSRGTRIAIAVAAVLAFITMIALIWDRTHRPFVAGLPEDLGRTGSPFAFVEWQEDSEMAEIEPDAVFAVLGGQIRVKFSFTGPDRTTLTQVGVSDHVGRPWFEIDLQNRVHYVNEYSIADTSITSEPVYTFRDTDGDALPDRRMTWSDGTELCLENKVAWSNCVQAEPPPD